jgi:hypothetical protein
MTRDRRKGLEAGGKDKRQEERTKGRRKGLETGGSKHKWSPIGKSKFNECRITRIITG